MKAIISPRLLVNSLLTASVAAIALSLVAARSTSAQSLTLSFRFDDGTENPALNYASLPTSMPITSANSGQVFTIDVFATVTGTGGTLQSRLGLESILYRALISSTNNNAFSSGSAIGSTGTVGSQYSDAGGTNAPYALQTPPPPYGPFAFFNSATTTGGTGWSASSSGTVGDWGTTSNGTDHVAGTSGVIGFGGINGATSTSALAAVTNGTSYLTSSTAPDVIATNVAGANSTTFDVMQFQFKIGNVNAAGGKTTLLPALPLLNNAQTIIATYKDTASTAINATGLAPYSLDTTGVSFVAPQAAGTTISVTPATDTASVLKGGAISLSKTVNNTGGTALAAGDYTFAASGGTAIGYTAMPSVPIPAPGSANFSTTATTTPGPGGTPIGLATVTFTATATGSAITNSPQSATTTLNVGGALADDSNTAGVYGPAISAVVPNGGSYAGLESAVVGLVNGPGGSNAAVSPFAPPWLGGDAKILAGTKSATVTSPGVSMAWRTRLVGRPTGGQLSETHGGPGSALQATTTTSGLASDVVNITGLETGSPNAGSTDPFVLDMTYNPGLLPKGGPAAIEANLAKNKLIYMVSPSPGPDNGVSQYVNTVTLNTGNVITSPLSPSFGFVGSYAFFQSAGEPGFGLSPAQELGAWGADPVNHEVWAVIDHNSTFAVVPEPATILLAGLGLLGLFGLRRAKKSA